MNKKFLIPLVLVVLGVLVPVVYASTRSDTAPESPSSASVEPAVEEEKVNDKVQENQQNDMEKDDTAAVEEDKDKPVSNGATTSNKGSQNEQSVTSSQFAGQSSSSKGKQQEPSSGNTLSPSQDKQVKDSKQKSGFIRVSITIVDSNVKPKYSSSNVDVKENSSVLDVLYATGVSCKVRSDGYVREISGLAENPRTGEGWMYAVNGGSPPGVGASSYTVSSGDRVLWYYGNIGDPPPKV